jgi:hypothetical protein
MAQVAGRGLNDLLVTVVSLYPKALRSGIGYWTEMVVNSSGYVADMIETAVAVASRPGQTREALAQLLDRYRAYLVSSGDTLERAILDFNQAVMSVARRSSDMAAAPGDPRIVEVFQQLADFATTEALKHRSGQSASDFAALGAQLEACLAEVRRLAATHPVTP